ncbi:MAG: alpha/beta hydrolase [Pseudomonadota bacterium]
MSISKTLHFSVADDVNIAASSYGYEQNPVVIMLHGAGQTRHSWHRSAKSIAENGFYVLTLDARGHGESDWSPQQDYAIDTLIDDLRQVLLQVGSAKPAVVGASLGGITALLAQGEDNRQLFSLLSLVDITPSVDMQGVARILEFMSRFSDGFATLDEAASAIAAYKKTAVDKNRQGLQKNLRRGENGRYYWHWDPALLNHVGHFGREIMQRQREAAGRLSLPVLLVHAKMSEIVSDADAKEFLQLVPHAEYVDVAEATHMLATDSNDAFASTVVEFLNRHHR